MKLYTKIMNGLVFLLILLILFIEIKIPYYFYDEGFALFNSTRIIHGDVPYKDFWTIYPPGQFYAIAKVFEVFGSNLLSSRIYDTLLRFLLVIGVYLIVKIITSSKLALLAALITGVLLASAGFYSYAVFPAMNMGLWAIWCWLKYSSSRQNRWLVFSGIFLGITMLIRWDIGLYAGVSILVAGYLFLYSCTDVSFKVPIIGLPEKKFHFTRAFFAPFKILIWAFGPAITIAFLGYTTIAIRSGWDNLYGQVFYFPIFILHSVRWLTFPSLILSTFLPSPDWLIFYLPIMILIPATILYTYRYLRYQGRYDLRFYGTISLILFATLLFTQAFNRFDYIHVLPASILTFMVCASLFYQVLPRFHSGRMKCVIYLIMAIPTIIYFEPAVQDLYKVVTVLPPLGCYSHLEKAACIAIDPDQEKAVEFIQAKTQPSDPIFVGNQQHDRININDVGFYYLAERPSNTRYHELHPGLATTLKIQTEIAKEIDTRKVKWVVLVNILNSTELNVSSLSNGAHYLDDYLRSHYESRTVYGNYRIMERTSN